MPSWIGNVVVIIWDSKYSIMSGLNHFSSIEESQNSNKRCSPPLWVFARLPHIHMLSSVMMMSKYVLTLYIAPISKSPAFPSPVQCGPDEQNYIIDNPKLDALFLILTYFWFILASEIIFPLTALAFAVMHGRISKACAHCTHPWWGYGLAAVSSWAYRPASRPRERCAVLTHVWQSIS